MELEEEEETYKENGSPAVVWDRPPLTSSPLRPCNKTCGIVCCRPQQKRLFVDAPNAGRLKLASSVIGAAYVRKEPPAQSIRYGILLTQKMCGNWLHGTSDAEVPESYC